MITASLSCEPLAEEEEWNLTDPKERRTELLRFLFAEGMQL
jgi:hypothetical protein